MRQQDSSLGGAWKRVTGPRTELGGRQTFKVEKQEEKAEKWGNSKPRRVSPVEHSGLGTFSLLRLNGASSAGVSRGDRYKIQDNSRLKME